MNTRKEFDQSNKQAWGKAIRTNQMLYPSEKVIAFLARNFKNTLYNNEKRALDIGFGSGRHIKALLDFQFQTYGIDYSQDSVDIAKKILGKQEKLISLQKKDLSACEFGIDFFDVIICYGVLFLRPLDSMREDLKKVHSLLKPGGKVLINFATNEDSLYGKGKEVADNTYLLDKSAEEYEGMLYTFLNSNQARELAESCGFKIELFEREDYWKNNLNTHRSWWILTLSKE